jgi:tRNA U55 pseudouridine synthase TruB
VPRKRNVFYLKLIEISKENPRLALFEAKVDAGTYIRTLCKDIGKKCGGARMEELRRTAVGKITEKEAFGMYKLVDALWYYKKGEKSKFKKMLRAPESLIELPRAHIKESALESVLSGAQIMIPAIEKMEEFEPGQRVSLYCNDRFIGVGVVKAKELKGKGLGIQLERVHYYKEDSS